MQPMTSQILGLHVAGALFWLVATLHLLRVLFEIDVIIGGWVVPPWSSGIAVMTFGALGWWMMRLAHSGNPPGCC